MIRADELLVTLLLVLPMAGFVLTALVGRRLGTRAWIIAVPVIIVTWLVAMVPRHTRPLRAPSATRPPLHALRVDPGRQLPGAFNLVVDNLTAVMLLVVTTIGMLVHVYSIGYMAHDPGRWRFFAYLNLFMFSMLLLVLAGNYLLVFAAVGAGRPVELPAHRLLVQTARLRYRFRARRLSIA